MRISHPPIWKLAVRGFLYCQLFLASASVEYPDVYDFVIVGGGTAGCTLANRLTENGKYSVLLLEVGGYPHPDLDIPALASRYMDDPEYVKTYLSVPQRNAGLAQNGTIVTLGGRTLGGSTSINAMYFNRGSPHDFDNWAKLTKDESWNYSNMLPYFRKSENYEGDFPSVYQHGYGGPITVSRPKYAPGLHTWLDAGQSLGYPVADPNGPQNLSYSPIEFSKRFGRRVNAYSGYVRPVLIRKNLRIVTHAEATQIIFEGRRVVGVKYVMKRGRNTNRLAVGTKELIISAGAFESAALLLKSGIGPKPVLDAVKIRQVKELPVGQNLQDHPTVRLTFILNNRSTVYDPERDLNPETMRIYNKFGDGPYSSYSGFAGQAFLKSSKSEPSHDWADIHLGFSNTPSATIPLLLEYDRTVSLSMSHWEVAVGCYVALMRPKSRGVVTLRMNYENATSTPVIDYKFLTHPKDLEILVDGIKGALETFEKTPTFKALGARLPSQPWPACRHLKFRSDEYWKCYTRELVGTGLHNGGTCRMGSGPQDKFAVVDSTLRLIGFEGIRVVDASIMPVITNANLQAPVYAIAEKASDMILSTWESSKNTL